MASTAIVSVGSNHPNDGSIAPTHFLQLMEGDRAKWVLRAGNCAHPQVEVHCASPDRIATDLIELVRDHCAAASALTVTIFEGSSLVGAIPMLKAMDDLEIEICRPVWSRRWNQWSQEWEIRGDGGALTPPGSAETLRRSRRDRWYETRPLGARQ